MSDLNFIQNLKSGDRFVTYVSIRGWTIYTVKRVTKTKIIACFKGREDLEINFNRKTGNIISNSKWYYERIQEITPEIYEEIKRKKLLYTIEKFRFDTLTNKELETVYNIIKKDN